MQFHALPRPRLGFVWIANQGANGACLVQQLLGGGPAHFSGDARDEVYLITLLWGLSWAKRFRLKRVGVVPPAARTEKAVPGSVHALRQSVGRAGKGVGVQVQIWVVAYRRMKNAAAHHGTLSALRK